MTNISPSPVKLYIQDVFRAKQSEENRYLYEMFGLKFKNIMIHGVVTSVYNTSAKMTNFELSDPTGSIQIYCAAKNNNFNINENTLKDLVKSFARKSQSQSSHDHDKLPTMSSMLHCIEKNSKNCVNFENGSHVSVVGDIFVEDLSNSRMICAYVCRITSVERDLVWLEELRYLYENYYLKRRPQ
ncbi:uncharacterized protein LOC112046703 [Bicyclus anynana]|uniref:Uncharacterized protein LOC112046703 n=1 Tax=Bicyclus anynana TaxID=110368 RepID=A0A6J1N260_BICAN|nr:uncharacterized protein LOC112046703 [Bicyclus anynana]